MSEIWRVQYFDDVRTAAWHLVFKGRRHVVFILTKDLLVHWKLSPLHDRHVARVVRRERLAQSLAWVVQNVHMLFVTQSHQCLDLVIIVSQEPSLGGVCVAKQMGLNRPTFVKVVWHVRLTMTQEIKRSRIGACADDSFYTPDEAKALVYDMLFEEPLWSSFHIYFDEYELWCLYASAPSSKIRRLMAARLNIVRLIVDGKRRGMRTSIPNAWFSGLRWKKANVRYKVDQHNYVSVSRDVTKGLLKWWHDWLARHSRTDGNAQFGAVYLEQGITYVFSFIRYTDSGFRLQRY